MAASLGIAKTRLGDPACDLMLAVTEQRLELRVIKGEADLVGGKPVYADLSAIDTTSSAGRKLDMPLLKAVGIKKGDPHRPRVIDCTAGFGEDAWLLASHGCTVKAIERQPVIAALLTDAVARAAQVAPETAERITPRTTSAVDWLTAQALSREPQACSPDAVVLDPMFPLGRKAKERKPMRVLRMLAGDDDDAPALLDAALRTGARRVCIKRPLHAAPIAHPKRGKPDVVHKGKAVRFDVYINP